MDYADTKKTLSIQGCSIVEESDHELTIRELNETIQAYDLKIRKLEVNLTIAEDTINELTERLGTHESFFTGTNNDETPRKKQKLTENMDEAFDGTLQEQPIESTIDQEISLFRQQLVEAQTLLAEKELIVDTLKDELHQLLLQQGTRVGLAMPIETSSDDKKGLSASMRILKEQDLVDEVQVKNEEIEFLRTQLAAKNEILGNLMNEKVKNELFELSERYVDLLTKYEHQKDQLDRLLIRNDVSPTLDEIPRETSEEQGFILSREEHEKLGNSQDILKQYDEDDRSGIEIDERKHHETRNSLVFRIETSRILSMSEQHDPISSCKQDDSTCGSGEIRTWILKEVRDHLEQMKMALVHFNRIIERKSNEIELFRHQNGELQAQLLLKENDTQRLCESHATRMEEEARQFAEKQEIFEKQQLAMDEKLSSLQAEHMNLINEHGQYLLETSQALEKRDGILRSFEKELHLLEKRAESSSLDHETKIGGYEYELSQLHESLIAFRESYETQLRLQIEARKDTEKTYQNRIDLLDIELTRLRRELDESAHRLSTVLQEHEILELSHETSLIERQTLSEELENLRSTFQSGKETFIRVTSQLEHRIAELVDEKSCLTKERGQLIMHLEQIQQSAQLTQYTVEDLEQRLKMVRATFEELKNSSCEKDSQIISFKQNEIVLREQMECLRDKNMAITEQASLREAELSRQLSNLRETYEIQHTQLQECMADLDTLGQTCETFRIEAKHAKEELLKIQMEYEVNESRLRELDSQLSTVQNEAKSTEHTLLRKIEQLESEHGMYVRLLDESKHRIHELEKSFDQSQRTIQLYREKGDQLEGNIMNIRQELESALRENQKWKEQVVTTVSQEAYQAVLKEKEEIERERDGYLDRYHTLVLKAKRLEKQIAELKLREIQLTRSSKMTSLKDLESSNTKNSLGQPISGNAPRLVEKTVPKPLAVISNLSSGPSPIPIVSGTNNDPISNKKQVTLLTGELDLENIPERPSRPGLTEKPIRKPLARLADSTTATMGGSGGDEQCQVQ
jgi:hypothetical protein